MQGTGDVLFDKPLDAKLPVLLHVNRLVVQDAIIERDTDGDRAETTELEVKERSSARLVLRGTLPEPSFWGAHRHPLARWWAFAASTAGCASPKFRPA
jgi:hypothetical protein